MYAEATPGATGARPILRRIPGLVRVADITAQVHCRGLINISGTVLVVLNNRVWSLTKSGTVYTATNLGALDGTLPVTMAVNNAATPNIVAVTENGCFNLFTGSAPTSFADADLPAPNSVSILGGYFIWTIGDGRIFASGLNAVTVDALANTRAQQRSDGLTRGVAFGGRFFAFGTASCEVYRDAGTSPFPLVYETMIPRGIAGAHAVAGWEEGWSNAIIFVGDDSIVYELDGYTPRRISTHDVERDIEALGDRSVLEASVHMAGGHAFWCLSSPSWTWVYDRTTGFWHERESYGQSRWRGSCAVKAFDEWIVGDETLGALYRVSEAVYREHNDPIVARAESDRMTAFPAGAAFPRSDFYVTAGQGVASGANPIETNPRVSISWSDDGGVAWSTPVTRETGAQGKSRHEVSLYRTGRATRYGRRWRVECSDPVHFALQGGDVLADGRDA